MKFINPFTDYGFKKIFGQEVSKDLLISFLNALLEGERVITDLAFGDKEMLGDTPEKRSMIYDVFCQTQTGERIIVEMQNRGQANFFDRILFYASRAISGQSKKGDEWDYGISAVYAVAFMNFTVDGNEKVRTDYKLTDIDDSARRSDKLRLTFIQLPRYTNDDPELCANTFDKWIYVLKHMETMERMPYAAQDAVFKRLEAIASFEAMTPSERNEYDAALKIYRDNYAVEVYAEKRRRELDERDRKLLEKSAKLAEKDAELTQRDTKLAKKDAELTEREAKLAAMEAEIRAKAATPSGERKAMELVARRMLKQGVGAETVADFTGLTAEEVERLRADLD